MVNKFQDERYVAPGRKEKVVHEQAHLYYRSELEAAAVAAVADADPDARRIHSLAGGL